MIFPAEQPVISSATTAGCRSAAARSSPAESALTASTGREYAAAASRRVRPPDRGSQKRERRPSGLTAGQYSAHAYWSARPD